MSSSIESVYSFEYIQFIRANLIKSCYMEFCKEVYDNTLQNSIYAYELLYYKNDKYTWDKVFQKQNDLFLYYLHLTTDYLSILPKLQHIVYSPTQTSSTYEQVTFQDFVDERVNMQQIGYREYQTFIKSMNDYNFKKKLIEKYRIDTETRSLKNYVIYVIQLILSKSVNCSDFFTVDEHNDMNITINPIPYFEYKCRTEKNVSSNETNSPNVESFIKLETRVLQQITNNI